MTQLYNCRILPYYRRYEKIIFFLKFIFIKNVHHELRLTNPSGTVEEPPSRNPWPGIHSSIVSHPDQLAGYNLSLPLQYSFSSADRDPGPRTV